MRVAGNELRFSLEGVLERLEGAELGPVREHAVEVKGKYLPVKEAFALISGLDLLDFNTTQARTAFRKLGLKVIRQKRHQSL